MPLLAALMLPLALLSTPTPLSLPPSWEGRAIYCQSFDAPNGTPELCAQGLEATNTVSSVAGGLMGKGRNPGKELVLRGAALSVHKPLTVSFWWALQADATKDTGFGLLSLYGKAGYISLFARSGPWCGLTRSAGVLQIYNLPGIQNVNNIYDNALSDHVALKAGEWHHTALVVSAASLVTAYTDGVRVCQARVTGRNFSEQDVFNTLNIGGDGVMIDEVVVLNRPLTDDDVADYARALRQMRSAGYFGKR